MTDRPAVRFENVSVRFGAATALDGVNLSLGAGSIAALCGPNGDRKSVV